MNRVTTVVIGGGQRGTIYAQYAIEEPMKCKVVAIADLKKVRRSLFSSRHIIPSSLSFSHYNLLLSLPKIADAVIIATTDKSHAEIAIACANKKYDILLEKPMATTPEDCKAIVAAVNKNKCMFAVCHVLRYTPYSRKLKEIVDSGVLGDIINVQRLEPVGCYHFAHSYVRGNWRNESVAGFSLLAKSCHDIDWLRWVVGEPCVKVSSFGNLKHFTKEKKPKEAGDCSRCLDCAYESQCPYSAKRIYLDPVTKHNYKGWPVDIIVDGEITEGAVIKALREGPYGRCAYECDNDVCDNQVVNMQFSSGITASFSMVATTIEQCVRTTRIFGSRGEIYGDGLNTIKVTDFLTKATTIHHPDSLTFSTKIIGHGYGDYFIIRDFVDAVSCRDQSKILSGPEETLESHLMVFAAESSRHNANVQNIADF